MDSNPNFKSAKHLSFISSLIHQTGIRSVFPLGVLGVYVISYFKWKTESSIYLTFFLFPILTSFFTLFVPIGGVLEKVVGMRITLAISSLVLMIAGYLLSLKLSAGFTIVCYLIFGAGLGISAMVSVKATCYFYPDKKGMITSLLNSFSSVGVGIFNIIGDFVLINPKREQMVENKYYKKEIAEKYVNYVYFIMIVIPIFTIIAIIFATLSESRKAKALQEEEEQRISLQPADENGFESDRNNSKALTPEELNAKNKEKYKRDLKKIFTSFGIWRLFFECFLTSFLPLLVYNSHKTIALVNGRDQTVMVITSSIASVCLAFINPLWGYLYDKFSFKPLIIYMGIAGAFNGVFFLFAIFYDYLITLSVVFNNSLLAAANSIFFPHIMKIYGLKYSLEASGVIGLGIGITGILGAAFCYIINEMFDTNRMSYYISYGVGAGLCLLSLVFSLFEKEEKFVYDDDEQKEENTNKVETM